MDFKCMEEYSKEEIEELYNEINFEKTNISTGCYCGNYEVPVDLAFGQVCYQYTIDLCASFCNVQSSRCACYFRTWQEFYGFYPSCP